VTELAIECVECGHREVLPSQEGGMVAIAKLAGWTFPPPRCPGCSAAERERIAGWTWGKRS
jgi:hypothetical protein